MRKAVTHLKKSDPVLCAIIERVGPCRMEFGPAEFCSLAEAIVYQQLNGKAAVTIWKRFAALAGEPITPEGILKLSDQQLRGVGLSKQKSAYLKDLAAKTSAGLLDFSKQRVADLSTCSLCTTTAPPGPWCRSPTWAKSTACPAWMPSPQAMCGLREVRCSSPARC